MNKKNIILIVLLFNSLFAAGQTASIAGSIENSSYTKVVLKKAVSEGFSFVDSAKLVNGKFLLNLSITEPDIFLLVFEPSEQDHPVSSWVTVHPKEKITLRYDAADEIPLLTETKGSKEMAYMKSFFDLEKSTGEKLNEYGLQYETADDTEKQKIEALFNQESLFLKKNIYNLISENKNLLSSALLVTYFYQEMKDYLPLFEEVSSLLLKKYPQNEMVKQLQKQLSGMLIEGSLAPDIALPDQTGEIRRLSSLRGKVVLIDFWASWCKPCRMENPNVVKLYEAYKNKGFEIFSISLDNNKNAWEKAIKDDNLYWKNHVSDLKGWTSEGGKLYGVQSIPHTVLIDKEGRIIAFGLRGAELEQKLSEILEK